MTITPRAPSASGSSAIIVGRGQTHEVERADQVDPDHQLELGELHRAVAADDAFGRGDAGAVDQDRRRTVGLASLGERMLGGRRVPDVALHTDTADPLPPPRPPSRHRCRGARPWHPRAASIAPVARPSPEAPPVTIAA